MEIGKLLFYFHLFESKPNNTQDRLEIKIYRFKYLTKDLPKIPLIYFLEIN
jgi:hypothetical protein